MPVSQSNKTGLALPVRRDRGGYFAVKSGLDLAWSNLLTALCVPVGSRPMRRTWGSGLDRMVFESVQQDDPAFQLLVEGAASQWCPDVLIDSVSVVPASRGIARLGISFRMRDQTGPPVGQTPVPVGAV